MPKFNLKTLFRAAQQKVADVSAKTGAALTVAVASAPAFAGDMADAAIAEGSTGKSDLWAIGAFVVGVCAIGFMIGRAKRASS